MINLWDINRTPITNYITEAFDVRVFFSNLSIFFSCQLKIYSPQPYLKTTFYLIIFSVMFVVLNEKLYWIFGVSYSCLSINNSACSGWFPCLCRQNSTDYFLFENSFLTQGYSRHTSPPSTYHNSQLFHECQTQSAKVLAML